MSAEYRCCWAKFPLEGFAGVSGFSSYVCTHLPHEGRIFPHFLVRFRSIYSENTLRSSTHPERYSNQKLYLASFERSNLT